MRTTLSSSERRSNPFSIRSRKASRQSRRRTLIVGGETLEARRVFAAPVLGAIADQNLVSGETSSTIALNVTDPDTPVANLTFTGTADSELFLLDQDLGLDTYLNGTNYFTNTRGSNEKYLYSAETDTWFFLLANGNLFEFTGDTSSTAPSSLQGTLVGNVGADVYADPTLLHEAVSVAADVDFNFNTGSNPTFTISPEAGLTGDLVATVTVSDGTDTDSDTFSISVTTDGDAPVIGPIATQNLVDGQTSSAIAINVTDDDTATADLTFTATSESQLFVLDQELGLDTYLNGTNYFTDTRGSDEKYLFSAATDTWFYLLPNGNLVEFTGDTSSTAPSSLQGNVVANVGADVYADPTLLHEALSITDALTINVTPGANPSLTITPDAGVTGNFEVTLTASDGSNIDTEVFVVVVTEDETDDPVLGPISTQTVVAGETSGSVNINVTDSDTPIANLTFTGDVESEVFLLDQELGLDTYLNGTNYFTDTRGSDEKYLYSASTETWFYLETDGDLFRFTGDTSSTAPSSLQGVLVANLGAEVYADPTLLHEAVSIGNDVTLNITPGANPSFTITADEGVSGDMVATLTVSDGTNTDEVTFTIDVDAPPPPVLQPIAAQALVAGEASSSIALNVTDPDTATADITFTGTSQSQLFVLDQELGLDTYLNGTNYFTNARSSAEKYLYSVATDTWYFLLPNGNLFEFTGDISATGPASLQGDLIANVGVDAYADPTLLHEAISDTNDLVFNFVPGVNPTFTITPTVNASGNYIATVNASDGSSIDSQSFIVEVEESINLVAQGEPASASSVDAALADEENWA